MFCVYTRPRYQVSVYSNIGPQDLFCDGVREPSCEKNGIC